MIKKKICLLGAFGVGKTSLIRRFAHSIFDEKYHSTIGLRLDKKTVNVGDEEVLLMIWDVAGEEEFSKIPQSYYAGASGCLFVADGTRADTLSTLDRIRERVFAQLGSELPSVILLNKADLEAEWQVGEEPFGEIDTAGIPYLRTSAKSGEGVERAFALIAEQVLGD